ncbi:pheophorbide A oxygenase, putative [Ricinus communis]|uniref:Pheophorbide A oxygenase, putative n=1 Tax=Ricinus communis TaxID=3988 RepID=B9SM66_RICCO|nr:pheophorbide A oxygenase, putative [Ricinus communis]
MPVCDLNKKVPHAKRVIGINVVVWWDRNGNSWKVFDDICPHRLAPLSEGRIDQWGRLQCVYHGWCFSGSDDCKFIPQAPKDAPQNGIVWFWPNSDPQFKDILSKKKPPYIPELDDPSYSKIMGNRDLSFGFEILTENLLDPAHVPYAHYGLQRIPQPKSKEVDWHHQLEKNRVIWSFPRNFGLWKNKIVSRWILVLDSDLYLLHLEERKIMDIGTSNWQKACFLPTKSDVHVVAFQKWLRKYSGGQND